MAEQFNDDFVLDTIEKRPYLLASSINNTKQLSALTGC